MYQTHFNLSRKPFRPSPDPSFYYESDTHRKVLARLDYGLAHNDGFIVLTGDTGTGKTILLNRFEELILNQFHVLHVEVSPGMKSQELLKLISSSFGIKCSQFYSETEQQLFEIKKYLLSHAVQNRRVVVFVDDCHHLSQHLIKELKLLTAIQYQGTPLVQCILSGQSSFRYVIEEPEFAQLNQRVITTCHLSPLTRAETFGYINHRLTVAGYNKTTLFSLDAADAIHEFTSGVPKRINQICDRALEYASHERIRFIDEDFVCEVIEDLSAELGVTLDTDHHERRLHDRRATARRTLDRRKEYQAGIDDLFDDPRYKEPDSHFSSEKEDLRKSAPNKDSEEEEATGSTVSLRFPLEEFFRRRNSIRRENNKRIRTEVFAILLLFLPATYIFISVEGDDGQRTAASDIFPIVRFLESGEDVSAPLAIEEETQFAMQQIVENADQISDDNNLTKTQLISESSNEALPLSKDTKDQNNEQELEKPLSDQATQVVDKANRRLIEKDTSASKEKKIVAKAVEKPIAPKAEKITKPVKVNTDKPSVNPRNNTKEASDNNKQVVKVVKVEKKPIRENKDNKPLALSHDKLLSVVTQFSGAYKVGDLSGISAVLSQDVRTNDSSDKASLISQYEKLFNITEDRDISFKNINWNIDNNDAFGKGVFEASILEKGRIEPQLYSGSFTMQLKKSDKKIIITDMRYEYE